MKKLPSLSSKKLIKALLRAGFYIHSQRGSHVHLRHYQKLHLRVTVPYHAKFDLPPSIVNSILKQAGLSREEFLKLL